MMLSQATADSDLICCEKYSGMPKKYSIMCPQIQVDTFLPRMLLIQKSSKDPVYRGHPCPANAIIDKRASSKNIEGASSGIRRELKCCVVDCKFCFFPAPLKGSSSSMAVGHQCKKRHQPSDEHRLQ